MIKKIISILLCVTFTLAMFSVSVSAEDAEQYDIFLLPLISEKMLEEQKYDQIQVYWDKNNNIPFVSIDEATSVVGGSCNYKTDWYTVDKDYFYFRYNSQDDMRLYLGNSDYGILLLDGNLFESRLIHGRWYVDFFEFCDMFDSKINKIDLNSYNIQGLDTDDLKSYKNYLKEKKVSFFLYVYNGYSLSTIYKEIMKYKNTYVWDYSKYPETEVCFRSLVDQSGAYTKTLTYNYFSNIVNDWDNVVSVAVKPYKPDEHYTEALINITNVNYPAYAVQNDRYQNYSLTKGDSLYTMLNAYNVIDTFKGDSDAVNFLKNFIDTENYGKAVDSLVSDSQFGYVTSFIGAGLNTYQSAAQTVKMYKHLDGIDEKRMQLLQKGIINNDNLASMAEHDDKIRKAIEKCSVYSLGAISTGIDTVSNFLDTFDVPFNPARYNVRNPYLTILNYSLNNSASLKDSAEKLVNNYQNQTNQLYDILENSGESLVFSISNDVLMYALKSNPESAPIALVIGIIDGLISASKIEFGEELKKSELLYQYEYIEQLLLKGLDEKNKENLQTRLTMLLEASLCSYLITSNSSDEAIKDICSLLLTLDDKSDYITYFNDPRNHQSFGNIKELIFDYKTERINKGTISGKVLTEDKNPIKNAKIEVYTSSGNQAIRFGDDECYTDGNGEFSISMPEGKYLVVVTHDGYDPVNIEPVAVEKQKTNRIDNIVLKEVVLQSNSGNILKVDGSYYFIGFDENSNVMLYKSGRSIDEKIKIDQICSFENISNHSTESYYLTLYSSGNRIFYNKNSGKEYQDNYFCFYDVKSKEINTISSGRILDIDGNNLYYTTGSSYTIDTVCKYNVSNNKTSIIRKFDVNIDGYVYYEGLIENKLYFVNGTNIYIFDSQGNESSVSVQPIVDRFNINKELQQSFLISNFVSYNNKVYFNVYKTNQGSAIVLTDTTLTYMNTDGTDLKYIEVHDTLGNSIDMVDGNKVYIDEYVFDIKKCTKEKTNKIIQYYNNQYVVYIDNDSWYIANIDFSNPKKLIDKKTYTDMVSDAQSANGYSYEIIDDYLFMDIGIRTFVGTSWRGKNIKYVDTFFDLKKLNNLDNWNNNYRKQFIQAIIDNEDSWNKGEYDNLKLKDIYFFDIDFDGNPELLVKYGDNNQRVYKTNVYYYENGLKKYQSPINDGIDRFEIYLDTRNQKHILRGKNYAGTMSGAGSTHYFDIEINKNSSKSILYACDSWLRDVSSYETKHTYYKYNDVVYTTLEEVYNLKAQITENEYDAIMIEKSAALEPVYVTADSINKADYDGLDNFKKKEILEKAFDSFSYYERSDQIQYYNGNHYYTSEYIKNFSLAYRRFDFTKAKSEYKALPTQIGKFTINKDNKKEDIELSIDNFIIKDDKVYFTCSYSFNGPSTTANLYVCDLDGTHVSLICEYVFDRFIYSNGNIYFQQETANNVGYYGADGINKCYNITTGKITEDSHDFSFDFQGKFMKMWPYPNENQKKYYDGGYYYERAYYQANYNDGNMRLHIRTFDNNDYVVGRWWSQIV